MIAIYIYIYRPIYTELSQRHILFNSIVPVQDVYLASIGPGTTEERKTTGSTIELVQEEERGIKCVATIDGSLQPPDVRLYLDSEDCTDKFIQLVSDPADAADAGIVSKHQRTVEYSYVSTNPDTEFNQQNLTCIARQPDFPDTVTWAWVDVFCK